MLTGFGKLIAEDCAQRLVMEKFEGYVVRLDDQALPVLEAVRSSRSNHRMTLYGIMPEQADVRGSPVWHQRSHGFPFGAQCSLERCAFYVRTFAERTAALRENSSCH